jgi:hypothetical protein
MQRSAAGPSGCAWLIAAAGPGGAARHGARPERVRCGWALTGTSQFDPCGAARPTCGVHASWACRIGAIQNPKIFIFRNKKLFSLFKTQKYLYSELSNKFILAITKQGYNHLFHWNLTPLSHSNEIGDAACFVLKKQVRSCKFEKDVLFEHWLSKQVL